MTSFIRALALACIAAVAVGVVHADEPRVTRAKPELSIKTLDGKTFDLSAQRGHWVIVNFWATWCSPCIKEMPDISAYVAAHAKDVSAIGIAWEDTERDEIDAFVKQHPVAYALAQGDVYNPLPDFEVPRSLPVTFLIAPDGSVAKKFTGPITGDDLDKAMAAGKAR
ncbi:MAG: TlpA disulfide reductase family protein [Dokdonella sp.]|uniref:TlpA disulfide reductase family protein n=1 Tax=Dokdonella sp. TaxID=2291710 RepID=UPI003F7FCEAE